jgi:hypothetical protein
MCHRIAGIVHGVGHVSLNQRQRTRITLLAFFAALACLARLAACTRDAGFARFAGRALRTYLAALAWIAFLPGDAKNPGLSLGPYRTGLSTLPPRPRRGLFEPHIEELSDLLA